MITSVEVGFRKPRPEIYGAALASAGSTPANAVFVGESYGPDYLGPTRLGIDAYLIVGEHGDHYNDLPPDRRLVSVLDIEAQLTP